MKACTVLIEINIKFETNKIQTNTYNYYLTLNILPNPNVIIINGNNLDKITHTQTGKSKQIHHYL